MSLARRIKSAQRNSSQRLGCQTCLWWKQLTPAVQALVNDWLEAGHSRQQLYEIISAPDDSGDPVLGVSLSAWRLHMKHHDERCR